MPTPKYEKIFDKKVTDWRDVKADLQALKQEANVDKPETVKERLKMESATKEMSDFLLSEIQQRGPVACTDFLDAIKTIEKAPELHLDAPGMNAIMSQARVVILEVLKTQWIHLAIEKVGNKEVVKIKGTPATWIYPHGMDEKKFLKHLGLETPAKAKPIIDGVEHQLQQAGQQLANTPRSLSATTQRWLRNLSIKVNSPSTGNGVPGFRTGNKLQDIIGYHTFSYQLVDHPIQSAVGAVAVAIGIKTLFGLFKGEHKEHGDKDHAHSAPAGGGAAHAPGHAEGHEHPENDKKRGIFGKTFDVLTAPSRAFRALTDALVGLGILAGVGWAGTRYVQNGFDLKRTGKAMGQDVKNAAGYVWRKLGIPSLPWLPNIPWLPGNTPPNQPNTPPNNPNTPPNNPSNRPSASPEVMSYRNNKVQTLKGKIPSSIDPQFNPILGDLEKKGPKDGLVSLEKLKAKRKAETPSIDITDPNKVKWYRELEETMQKMLITEKSIDARKPTQLDATNDKIDNLYDALFPIDTKLNEVINKPSIQVTAIEQEIEKIIAASGLDKNKHKEVLSPLMRKVIGEICIKKLALLLNAERFPADPNHPKIDEKDEIFIDASGRPQSYKWVRELFESLQSAETDFIVTKAEFDKIINGNELRLDNSKIRIASISLDNKEEINKTITLIEWWSKNY